VRKGFLQIFTNPYKRRYIDEFKRFAIYDLSSFLTVFHSNNDRIMTDFYTESGAI